MSYELHVRFGRGASESVLRDMLLRIPGVTENGADGFCIDEGAECFIGIELDRVSGFSEFVAYGGPAEEIQRAIDVAQRLAEAHEGELFDPQLGRVIPGHATEEILSSWRANNEAVLHKYSDGRHFVRELAEVSGKKLMIEAQRFEEQTAMNFASAAAANARGGFLHRARPLFEQALALDQDNAAILYALGLVHYQLGDIAQAKAFLEKALIEEPGNEDATQLLSELLKDQS